MIWQIREGDALERLREMPDESVQCCVTSPPYFGLRDYGVEGQIGLEATPDEFIAVLVEVFREVRRVLRADGTLWLNIGDSYAGTWGNQGRKAERGSQRPINGGMLTPVLDGRYPSQTSGTGTIPKGVDYKAKDLLGIPWQLAFALRADGWYLRSDIIWSKANPMPESVTDRPTSAHEHVFLLAKSARYFYDADAIREEVASADDSRGRERMEPEWANRSRRGITPAPSHGHLGIPLGGRNKRNVWGIATQRYPDAHFATFPTKLVEPCVLAGSSPKACGECSAPWRRVVEVGYENPGNRTTNGPRSLAQRHETPGFAQRLEKRTETTGWEPTCGHQDDTDRCIVLDPFAGSGTTGLVAVRHDRSFIGIELSPSYAAMARDRIRDDAPLLNGHSEASAA